jgi:uncharacterized OB-fold protein
MSMTTDAYLKPVPEPTHESKPYWDALNEGRLLLQSCGACGRVRHYPRPLCDACYSFDVRWIEGKGRGTIHSWTITHHAFNPGFKAELPYVLATVDLTEGVRMQAPLRGVKAEDLRIGMPVRITFERAKNGLTLPAFVAAGSQ